MNEYIQERDVLTTGEVRIATLASRLRVAPRTVKLWCEGWRGIVVGRGKRRKVVHLKCVRVGRELRTRPEWWDEFFKATQRR